MTADAGSGAAGPAGDGVMPGRFEVLPGGREQPTVRAAGDIDLANAGEFQNALSQAAAASGAVTVDMTAVTYCDSAAICALFAVAGQARLTLIVPAGGPVTTLLRIAGLDQAVTVVTR